MADGAGKGGVCQLEKPPSPPCQRQARGAVFEPGPLALVSWSLGLGPRGGGSSESGLPGSVGTTSVLRDGSDGRCPLPHRPPQVTAQHQSPVGSTCVGRCRSPGQPWCQARRASGSRPASVGSGSRTAGSPHTSPWFPFLDRTAVTPSCASLFALPGLRGPQAQVLHRGSGGEDAGWHFHRAGERGPPGRREAEGAGSRAKRGRATPGLAWVAPGLVHLFEAGLGSLSNFSAALC